LPKRAPVALGLLALALLAAAAAQAAVTGTVRNGTNGTPAAGVDVVLIQLQGEMQTVASTKSDAQGKYTLDHTVPPGQPMLVRAIYRGVNFHQPLPPGSTAADVTVYEPTSDPKTLKVGTRVVMFQPSGSSLLVVDDYALQNDSQPPMAYFNAQGDFEFELPEGAQLSQVSSWGPSRMPVTQGTINRGNGKYAIAYAFQPGENGVRVTYQVPYESNQATLRFTSTHAAERVGLVAPGSVQVESAGFSPQGQEQGFNLYSRDSMPAGLPFEVSISGTAPMPSAADPGAGAGGSTGAIQVLPDRLDSLKWLLLGGFVALFALGVFAIWRRPVATGAAETSVAGAAIPRGRKRAERQGRTDNGSVSAPIAPPEQPQTERRPETLPTPGVAAGTASRTVTDVEREVEQGLDGLKDKLFRLELRRQAGTISEEEYIRERTQAEQILRELVGR
jgi:hypothetical protein